MMTEDKIPPMECHVWTLSDFIERRKDWNFEDESRLAEFLQQLSNKITRGATNTLNELDDLLANVDNTAVQIANINNEFQLLADNQFIENKVQEEDETVPITVEKPIKREAEDTDILVNNFKKALKNSFKAVDTYFEKVTVVVSDSDDDDDDDLKHEETILRPRIFYKKLNLPSLSSNTPYEDMADSDMSSNSDINVEQPRDNFKDEESISSNDVPEEDIHFISKSKSIHEPNPQPVDTFSKIYEPEIPKTKSFSVLTDNIENDLFSPPPLVNDNDEDDLDHEYNIFGNDNSNAYTEKSLWGDNDDEDDFSNDPPLPIHTDEPPLYMPISNTQEKIEVSSIQQTLNDELRKRFQKDDVTSSIDESNKQPSKIKLPKGAINILGGIDTNPYIVSTPDLKQGTTSQPNTIIKETKENHNEQPIKENLDAPNKLFDNLNQNPVSSLLKKNNRNDNKLTKSRSLFEQDSDNEDLFATVPVISSPKLEIVSKKQNSDNNVKVSRTIFSESDSDEDFMNSKSIKKHTASTVVKNDQMKLLNSSSDDDLFDIKSASNTSTINHKSIIFSSQGNNKIINKSKTKEKETNQKSKLFLEETDSKEILDKKNVNLTTKSSEKSSVVVPNIAIENDLFENKTILTSNNEEFKSVCNTVTPNTNNFSNPINKNINNLFSSDEDDFDDNTLFNVDKNNANQDPNQTNPSATKLTTNTNNIFHESKVELFDSSSDDDIFFTNKSTSNCLSTDKRKQSSSNEINSIDISKSNSDNAIINQTQTTENIDKINLNKKNVLDKTNTNVFSLLSDDDDDDLSFNNKMFSGPLNLSDVQSMNKNVKVVKLSSEELSHSTLPVVLKNEDILQNPSSNKDPELFSNIATSKSDTFSTVEDTMSHEKSPIFSSSDDQQFLSNSKTEDENFENKTKEISSIFDYIIDLKEPSKDFIDGSSYSSPSLNNESLKKLPGKLSKNVGAFINVAGLLPNSKNPLKTSDIPRPVSVDENNVDNLPTSETKLFSAEKERVRIQVKRRPQSRSARKAAAQLSSIDNDYEPISNKSSHLLPSSSDVVDYKSSPLLNDDGLDSCNKVYNESQIPLNKELSDNINETVEKVDENNKTEKKMSLDLFDDLDETESIKKEMSTKNYYNKRENALNEEQLKFQTLNEKQLDINPVNEKLPKIESTNEKQPKNDRCLDINKLKENKSKSLTQNITMLNKESSSIFSDDEDNIFSPKSEKVKKPLSNLFDSDEEFDFKQTFSKKNVVKVNSIFGDDSDDDLFSTPSKPTASSSSFQKSIDKTIQRHNRPVGDGYIKLAAESVAINPLETKKN